MKETRQHSEYRGPYTNFEVLLDHRSAVIILGSLQMDAGLSHSTYSSYLRVREMAIESMLLNKFSNPGKKQTAYVLNYEEVNLIGGALLGYVHFDAAQGTFLRLNSRFVRAGGKDNVEMRENFEMNQSRRLR